MVNDSWARFFLQCNEEKRIQNGFYLAANPVIPKQKEGGVLFSVPKENT